MRDETIKQERENRSGWQKIIPSSLDQQEIQGEGL